MEGRISALLSLQAKSCVFLCPEITDFLPYPYDNSLEGEMNQSLDDILFENRNKEYGAYHLRKRYYRWLFISFLISVVSVLMLVFGFFWYLNSDSSDMVYLFPSSYPNLKSTQGSLMDPKDLASYVRNPESPKTADAVESKKTSSDVLRDFQVVEKAAPDTLKKAEEEEPRQSEISPIGFESDSTIFGGYLLGEGEGGGSGNSLDKFPEFPGGPDGVRRYIEMSVIYPIQAIKQKINGVVIISFDVNKHGGIDNIQVERGVNSLLDREAVKAITNMPQWKPGIRHGKPVIVKFVIPVRFMPIS
jgi:periplasmic protein TonB